MHGDAYRWGSFVCLVLVSFTDMEILDILELTNIIVTIGVSYMYNLT